MVEDALATEKVLRLTALLKGLGNSPEEVAHNLKYANIQAYPNPISVRGHTRNAANNVIANYIRLTMGCLSATATQVICTFSYGAGYMAFRTTPNIASFLEAFDSDTIKVPEITASVSEIGLSRMKAKTWSKIEEPMSKKEESVSKEPTGFPILTDRAYIAGAKVLKDHLQSISKTDYQTKIIMSKLAINTQENPTHFSFNFGVLLQLENWMRATGQRYIPGYALAAAYMKNLTDWEKTNTKYQTYLAVFIASGFIAYFIFMVTSLLMTLGYWNVNDIAYRLIPHM